MSRLRLRPHRKVPTNHPNAKILRLIHTREVGRLTSCLSSDSIGVMDPPPAWTMGGGLGGALAGSCASLARNRSVSARFGLTASILCVKSRHMVTPTDEPAGWRIRQQLIEHLTRGSCATTPNFAVKRRPPQSALTRSTDGGSDRVEHGCNSPPRPRWIGPPSQERIKILPCVIGLKFLVF